MDARWPRRDRSDSRGQPCRVRYDFIIWFGGLVLAMFAAIPLLKLRMLHPHERLARRDAVLVAGSIFVEVALVSLVFLDILQFGWRMPQIVDDQLHKCRRRNRVGSSTGRHARSASRWMDYAGFSGPAHVGATPPPCRRR